MGAGDLARTGAVGGGIRAAGMFASILRIAASEREVAVVSARHFRGQRAGDGIGGNVLRFAARARSESGRMRGVAGRHGWVLRVFDDGQYVGGGDAWVEERTWIHLWTRERWRGVGAGRGDHGKPAVDDRTPPSVVHALSPP